MPRADAGWYLAIPLVIAGIGLGLLVSQLNNYTLAPIVEERVSEAAGVNSASGSFGLSFGLAFAGAIMLATLAFSFTYLADQSVVLDPAEQQAVADVLEHDAEVMTNTDLAVLLEGQPPAVQAEIIRINTEARPFALQVALLIPIIASLLGLLTSFRMMRQPDPGLLGHRRDGPGLTSRVLGPPEPSIGRAILVPAARATGSTSGCYRRTIGSPSIEGDPTRCPIGRFARLDAAAGIPRSRYRRAPGGGSPGDPRRRSTLPGGPLPALDAALPARAQGHPALPARRARARSSSNRGGSRSSARPVESDAIAGT